jgi:hypothetical protein
MAILFEKMGVLGMVFVKTFEFCGLWNNPLTFHPIVNCIHIPCQQHEGIVLIKMKLHDKFIGQRVE